MHQGAALGSSFLATDGRDIRFEGFAYLLDENGTPTMAKSEGFIEVQVEHTGKEGSPVRRVALAVAEGCSIEVARRDDTVVVRLSTAGSGICLKTNGQHSDFARAINLLRLYLPRCRT